METKNNNKNIHEKLRKDGKLYSKNEKRESDNNKRDNKDIFKYVIVGLIIIFVIIALLNSTKQTNSNKIEENESLQDKTNTTIKQKDKKLTEAEIMLEKIESLYKEKQAFDRGNYIQGEIPAGEYVFVKLNGSSAYYEEDDAAGEIIDNENFDSFGYVKVHAAGNLETGGILINVEALEKLGINGAKELYEVLTDQKDWNQAGYYKVGTDIEQGKYILESIGDGYWEIASGPIGSNDIIDNDNYNGRTSINIINGQYLILSRSKFTKSE